MKHYIYKHANGNYLHVDYIGDGEVDNLLVTEPERATIFTEVEGGWGLTEILEACGYEIVIETSYGHTNGEVQVAETDFTKHYVKLTLLN